MKTAISYVKILLQSMSIKTITVHNISRGETLSSNILPGLLHEVLSLGRKREASWHRQQ